MDKIIGTFVVLLNVFQLTQSDFEVCNPFKSSTVFKFTAANCPNGVLFDHPITANCLGSSNEPEHFISDLCESEQYELNPDTKPYKIHLALKMSEEPVDADQQCIGEEPDKCNVTSATEATSTTLTEPGGIGCDADDDDDEIELSEEEAAVKQQDVQVANQTERLFKFMLGLTVERDYDGPNTRIVKILKQSFRILGKFCDSRFVPLEFGQDVLQAFLFLFREADKSGFRDMSTDDYFSIKKTLDYCEGLPKPFNLTGQICNTCSNAHSIEKNGKSRRYIRDEFSFQWGKYDVPVDATWSVLNFVHGLCYGNYRPHVNFHHLFQREFERLFLPPLLHRWTRPVTLHHEDLWDHIFSARVKNAMKNLDVCVSAAYHDSPFLHRLERPIKGKEKQELDEKNHEGRNRKKRSIPTMLLDDGGLQGAGWCFQSEDDMLTTVRAYIDVHCPTNTNIYQEIYDRATDEGSGGRKKNGTDTESNGTGESAGPPPAEEEEEGFGQV